MNLHGQTHTQKNKIKHEKNTIYDIRIRKIVDEYPISSVVSYVPLSGWSSYSTSNKHQLNNSLYLIVATRKGSHVKVTSYLTVSVATTILLLSLKSKVAQNKKTTELAVNDNQKKNFAPNCVNHTLYSHFALYYLVIEV